MNREEIRKQFGPGLYDAEERGIFSEEYVLFLESSLLKQMTKNTELERNLQNKSKIGLSDSDKD